MSKVIPLVQLEKPKYGASCNHCGLCCAMELCEGAVMALDMQNKPQSLPCPFIFKDGEKVLCGIVKTEIEHGLEPIFQQALGIGTACLVEDNILEITNNYE